MSEAAAPTCAGCGSRLPVSALACPGCHTLVHAEALTRLAAEAGDAARRSDVSGELSAWRTALDLLPPASTQFQTIQARVEVLSAGLVGAPVETGKKAEGTRAARWGVLAAGALFLWKFKAVLAFALTKGKLLALGLTKSSTVFSMLASLGVYWAAYGWRFAAGLIASIYVHEMGHVAALRRFGIAASAPMFIPGLGAVIRARQALTNPREDARVGLGGPIWGLMAALAAYGVYTLTGSAVWAAIGHFGAFVNLFNLMPVWQLDGARAFRPMTRVERWLAAAAVGVMFAVTREGLLVLVLLLAAMQAWNADETEAGDRGALLQFVGLVVVLSWMCTWVVGAAA
jgi:Zn-dependent protease